MTPVIFAAIGEEGSGRDTCMRMLVDHLYDSGYKKLKAFDLQNPTLTDGYIYFINRLENLKDYKLIKDTNLIIFHVKRNPYKEGQGHNREIKNATIAAPWVYDIPSIPIRNDDNLRLFNKQVIDMFYNFVTTHKNWKEVYGNK